MVTRFLAGLLQQDRKEACPVFFLPFPSLSCVLSASSQVSFCLTEKVECFSDYMTLQIPSSPVQGLKQWLVGVLRLPGKPSSQTWVFQFSAIDWLEPLLREIPNSSLTPGHKGGLP